MRSTKQIFEDLGSLTKGTYERETKNPPIDQHEEAKRYAATPISNIIRSKKNELQGVKLFDFSFHPWQQTLINTLGKNQNVYQVASPGAGKTAPVVFHWAKVLGLNPDMNLDVVHRRGGDNTIYDAAAIKQVSNLVLNLIRFFDYPKGSRNEIPKLLYLCPVRQLVYEIRKDFIIHISKVIYHFIHMMVTIDGDNRLKNVLHFDVNVLYDVLQHAGINIKSLVQQKTQMYNQLNHFTSTGINDERAQKLANDSLAIDEQIMKIVADRSRDFISKQIVCIKTEQDSITNPDAPILVTIYESGENVFKKMDQKRLRMIIIDEAHLAQQLDMDDSRAKQITSSLYSILKKFNNSTQQLVLLSGTVNPNAASNLIDYLDKAMGIPITRLDSGSAGKNPSNISVLPMDSLKDDRTLLKIMMNPTENNNVIILFSKARIDRLVNEALKKTKGHQYTADQIEHGGLQTYQSKSHNINMKDLERNNPKNINQGFELNRKKFLDAVNRIPGANEISDPTLLQAVMSGFGYIYRAKDNASIQQKKDAGKDAQIVANLFSKGKIRTLLATDAVGIGINLTIKNMYVPQIEKFHGNQNAGLPLSNASQLYNRTGRMSFTTSSIYTPQGNVDEVIKAISATNNSFEMRETLGRFKQILSSQKREMYFNIVWRKFSRSMGEANKASLKNLQLIR